MKTKFYWVALLASAALIAQAQGGGHYGGGGGGGGHFAAAGAGPARGGAVSSFHSMSMRSFGGGPVYSGRGFSPIGMRSTSAATFHQRSINSDNRAFMGTPRLSQGNSERGSHLTRSLNQRNQTLATPRREGSRADQFRRGSNLPPNWRNHVFAQHSGNWHQDWDRGREHWWNGHRCRFVDGSWFIFDTGFYPWGPDWYPYDYYGYGYQPYPYYYTPGYYDSDIYQGEEYSDQNGYGSSEDSADSLVSSAQEQLAREGYYRGEIDGRLGPQTRRAIVRYQSRHGLRVTGYLTSDTLQALGLGKLATN